MTTNQQAQTQAQAAGGCFTLLIAILFIVLKLTGAITWSWLWVLCPLWIGIAFSFLAFIVMGLFALLGIMIIAAKAAADKNKSNGWR